MIAVPTPAPSTARSGVVIAALSLSGILVALLQTLVVPVLPAFAVDLGVPPTSASWLVTITLLTGAVGTPLIGRLADMFGKRAMMLVCLGLMVAGSVLAAVGPGFATVVAGRGLQGFAMALLPVGISMMRDVLPPERLGSGVALMSATIGVGSVLGMPLSGVLYEHAGWQSLFWLPAGFAVVMAALLPFVVPESTTRASGRFDYRGAVLLTAALTAVLLAISKGGTWGWGSWPIVGLAVGGIVGMAVWVPLELRMSHPLVDLRTSMLRPVLVANMCALLLGFAMFLSSYASTQELQVPASTGHGLGLSAATAGLVMLPGGLVMIVLAPVSAAMIRGWGARVTLAVGGGAIALGFVERGVFGTGVLVIGVSAFVVSVGVAFALAAMPVLITTAVPRDQTASANSVNSLIRAVGTSAASAVGAAVLAASTVMAGAVVVPAQIGLDRLFWLGAAVAAVALLVVTCVPIRTDRTTARVGVVVDSDGDAVRVR
ncbi:MFS transporter [Rhodococcus sp. AG1013]|uniref:MFS transporter n=1 Tax=unclassified Rhodococcus (in: high G+C Gram-positive bacteria) TaxID=192944 RepID=UPI000E09EFF8|nr:MFS transporter [Rhodococcus sp. AG1013]RDI17615.1 MFS transporter [Rhodococcus sp. AG1013]